MCMSMQFSKDRLYNSCCLKSQSFSNKVLSFLSLSLCLGPLSFCLPSSLPVFSPPERKKKVEFSRGCNKNCKVPRCADVAWLEPSWPTYIINLFGFLSFRRLNAPSLGRPGQGVGLREGDGDSGVGWGVGAVADS